MQTLKDLNLSPFPTNLEEEIRYLMTESRTDFPDEKYPSEIKNMVNWLQGSPGGSQHLFKELFEFVNDEVIRRWAQPMLLAKIDVATIYITTSVKTDKIYEEGIYQAFQAYFFNVSSFSVKEKYLLHHDERDTRLKEFYQLALDYDKAELLWKMGFTPDLPIDQIVRSVAAESVMRMKRTTDDDKVARLGTLALKAADKLKEIDGEDKKDLEELSGIKFEILQEKPKFKTLKELE